MKTKMHMMALGLVSTGEQCEIVEHRQCGGCGGVCHDDSHKHDHSHEHGHGKKQKTDTRAEGMGLRPGTRLEMLKNDGNLLLVLVDNASSCGPLPDPKTTLAQN